jgi:hypothetical protein
MINGGRARNKRPRDQPTNAKIVSMTAQEVLDKAQR